MKQIMIGFAAGLLSGALSAETIVWSDAAAGETAEYGKDLAGANTLKIPAGTHDTVAGAQLYYANAEDATLTVDAAGATVNFPARTDGQEYAATVWGVYGLTPLAQLTRLSAMSATDAALTARNASFVARREGVVSSLVLSGADLNFSSAYCLDLAGGAENATGAGRVTLAGGVYELGELKFSGVTRAENELKLTDGVNLTADKFIVPMKGTTVAHTNRLTISGADTKVRVNDVLSFGGGAGVKREADVVIEDGAELSVNRMETIGQQKVRLFVRNGARVDSDGQIDDNNNYKLGFSMAGEDVRIVLDNAAWTMPIGTRYSARYGGWGDCSMQATNSTVALNGTVLGVGEWHFDSCMITNFIFTLYPCHGSHQSCVDALFKNCTVVNPWPNFARMSVSGDPHTDIGESCLTFDGGTADMFRLGAGEKSAWGSGNGRIVLKNGADVWTHGSNSGINVLGLDGTGVVEVVGASWRLQYPNNLSVFGQNAGSFGLLKVGKDGVVADSSSAGGMTFGSAGDGRLEVREGSFASRTVTLAASDGTKGEVVLKDCEVTVAAFVGGAGTSSLAADGAKIVCSAAGSLFSNLGSVTVGAKGLEISSDFACTLSQDIVPEPGAEATLTLSGSGAKTLSGKVSVPCLVVRGCRLVAAEGCDLSATALELLDGATLALADGQATVLALQGLVLGDETGYGTIEADVTDRLTLATPPVIGKGMVALSGEYANDSYSLLSCLDEVSQETAAAWAAAYLAGGRITGRQYSFETTRADGVTSFSVVVADAAPVTDTARWTASGASVRWETEANWEGGVKPSASSVATFDTASAAPTAILDSTATVGAVLFDTASGSQITGGGSLVLADTGTGSIKATQGANALDVSVVMPAETEFFVGAGASLAVNGALVNGAVNKTGPGRLVLSNDENRLISGITVGAGVVEAASAAALGYNAGTTLNALKLGNAMLKTGATETRERLGHPLTVDPGAGKVAEVVNAGDLEATMTSKAFVSGRFVKRGAGELTLVLPANQLTVLGTEGETIVDLKKNPVVFSDEGVTEDVTGLGAFAVAEGSLVLKAGGAGTQVQLTGNKPLMVGVSSQEVTAKPELICDGIQFDPPQERGNVYLGCGKYAAKDAAVRGVNGAELHIGGLYIGDCPELDRTDPVFELLDSRARIREMDLAVSSACVTHLQVKNSNFGVDGTFAVGVGSLVATFDGGVFGSFPSSSMPVQPKPFTYRGSAGSSLDVSFLNGSTACIQSFAHLTDSDSSIRLAFGGGSVWNCGSDDVDLTIRAGENAHVEMLEGGLSLSVADGKTFLTRTRFDGVGGLVKTGAGTLRFGRRATLDASKVMTELGDVRTWCFTGVLSVRGGTVEVEGGASSKETLLSLAAGTVLDLQGGTSEIGAISGAGTVRNGALGDLRIGVTAVLPAFAADFAVPSKITLDFGRTAANPLDLKVRYPVARFEGLSSGTYRVRVKGTGHDGDYRGTLTIGADGLATVSDISIGGLILVVR